MNKRSHLKKHMGYWISRLHTQIHVNFESKLNLHSISVAQWCVLISLYDNQANSVVSLSKYIEVNKSAISRVVEQLVKKSLIIIKDGIDRRSQIIVLTDEAYNLVPQLLFEADQNDVYYFNCLDIEELKQLKSIIKKIIINKTKININDFKE